MSDPYQPPSAEHRPRTDGALYSTQGIVMGTILGSLAAGVVMLYLNYQALGRANLAKTISLWGLAFFLILIMVSSFTPNTAVTALLFLGIQAAVAYFMTEKLQGDAIRYHREHAGAMHSNLRAAAVGFLTALALVFALVVAASIWMAVTGTVPAVEPAPGA